MKQAVSLLAEALRIDLGEREEDSIGGVAFSELGHNPQVGDRVELGPLAIEVVEVQRNRVKTVKVIVGQPATVESGRS